MYGQSVYVFKKTCMQLGWWCTVMCICAYTYVPKYMSYHEAIDELVITGRARCLSFWLLDYICGYYTYRYYIYYIYVYIHIYICKYVIYIYIYIYYLMFGRYSTLYLKPIWNHISCDIFILYCICLCLYWKESYEKISFFFT